MGASASRTSATWPVRISTSVRQVKVSPTATPTKNTGWCYAAIGPMPARAAPSNTAAPPARNDGSRDGSNPFPYEDVAPRRHRNGAARAHLQSHPRHQHHGARTADRSNQDVALAVTISLLNAAPLFEVRTARTREPSS